MLTVPQRSLSKSLGIEVTKLTTTPNSLSVVRRMVVTSSVPSMPAGSPFQVGDVDLMDPRLLSKVNLPPTPGAAQLPDSLACRLADVTCHSFMVELVFPLYLAHTLFGV